MYLNYRNFSVEFREDSGEFRCFYTASGEEHESEFLRDGSMYLTAGGRRYELLPTAAASGRSLLRSNA